MSSEFFSVFEVLGMMSDGDTLFFGVSEIGDDDAVDGRVNVFLARLNGPASMLAKRAFTESNYFIVIGVIGVEDTSISAPTFVTRRDWVVSSSCHVCC